MRNFLRFRLSTDTYFQAPPAAKTKHSELADGHAKWDPEGYICLERSLLGSIIDSSTSKEDATDEIASQYVGDVRLCLIQEGRSRISSELFSSGLIFVYP